MLMSYEEIVDRMVEWAVREEKVRALWIEGDTLQDVRRPYETLRLHAAADEPLFPALLSDLTQSLDRITQAEVVQVTDTPRFAKKLLARGPGNLEFTLVLEQSNLLAKRPRCEVIPLVDKTGHLCHVLDFSLRRRT